MLTILLAVSLCGSFDVSITHWDNKRYDVRLESGSAICAWPGKEVVITPTERNVRAIPSFECRRRGRGFTVAADRTRLLSFRMKRGNVERAETLALLVPERVETDSTGFIVRPTILRGYPLGRYPLSPPRLYRDRAEKLSRYFYVVTDTSLAISKHFTIGDFISRIKAGRTWRGPAPLSLDYGMVDMLERIQREWSRLGYRGRVRIESPFRTPDYNDADEAGRATFSLHMYGSASDIILTEENDRLHDDLNGDGVRTLEDLMPCARAIERAMKAKRMPPGGLGVYHYIYRDGRPEEFQIHVDIRGKLVTWGTEYDSDTKTPSRRIEF